MDIAKIKKQYQSSEDRKKDLQITLQFVCDEYDLCVAANGANHPQCMVLLSIKQQVQAELELVCSQMTLLECLLEMQNSGKTE